MEEERYLEKENPRANQARPDLSDERTQKRAAVEAKGFNNQEGGQGGGYVRSFRKQRNKSSSIIKEGEIIVRREGLKKRGGREFYN